MGISKSIFAHTPTRTDSAAPSPSDIVGAFKIAYQNARGLPVSTDGWLVRTDDPDVADIVAEMFGGEPRESGNDKLPIEVETPVKAFRALVAPGGIRSGFVLWGNRAPVSRCDGERITWSKDDPQEVGSKCACAGKSIEDRKKAAERGTGCKPDISVLFALKDNPGMGKFRIQSGSWVLLNDIQEVEDIVADAEDDVELDISFERVTTKAGKEFSKITIKAAK